MGSWRRGKAPVNYFSVSHYYGEDLCCFSFHTTLNTASYSEWTVFNPFKVQYNVLCISIPAIGFAPLHSMRPLQCAAGAFRHDFLNATTTDRVDVSFNYYYYRPPSSSAGQIVHQPRNFSKLTLSVYFGHHTATWIAKSDTGTRSSFTSVILSTDFEPVLHSQPYPPCQILNCCSPRTTTDGRQRWWIMGRRGGGGVAPRTTQRLLLRMDCICQEPLRLPPCRRRRHCCCRTRLGTKII